MTGAETLVDTLLASDVSICFANPGTSEMHFVAALDRYPEMRCVLCLFEGGASGAADGYFRMSGRLACTLLHLAPGFGNAWSNLHNARKGRSAVVNIVGDHAGYHLKHDAPLQADLDGVAGSVSHWVRRADDASVVAMEGASAIRAARSAGGQIATLVLPADAAWSETVAAPQQAAAPRPLHHPDADRVAAAAESLAVPGAALLVNGPALYGDLAVLAARIATRTGCRLIAPFFAPRITCGAGSVRFEKMLYPLAENRELLKDVKRIVCVGEAPPVSFFAYPSRPSTPEPAGCAIDRLCYPDWDIAWTIGELARVAGVDGTEPLTMTEFELPAPPNGSLTPDAIGRALARHLPDGAIVVNGANSAGSGIWPHLNLARVHDLLNVTGGSIGFCLPAAVGAAIVCPERRVFAVSGDGSAIYQAQSLWTMAREELDVIVIIVSNGGYQILHGELANLGLPAAGRNARRMFDLVEPSIDWRSLAKGFGVPGARAETAEDFADALEKAADIQGPFLIEAVV